jgi:hypothetical protein
MRAISGSADGKIRIWNILNGDCMRVMRGNSQSNPILSLCVVENRILVNTEYNLLLLEFEPIRYNYDKSNSYELIKPDIDDIECHRNDSSKSQMRLLSRSRPYSVIRASRMELAATPNTKLFNDNRKSVLEHSARPVSAKCLKEAQSASHASLANKLRAKSGLLRSVSRCATRNSALTRRSALSTSIESRQRARSSKSHISESDAKANITEKTFSNYFHSNRNISMETDGLSSMKVQLREQLDKMRQMSQSTNANSIACLSQIQILDYDKKLETSSSLSPSKEPLHVDLDAVPRPTSSPSDFDTRTKIKLNQNELNKIKMKCTNSMPPSIKTGTGYASSAIPIQPPMLAFVKKVFIRQDQHSNLNLTNLKTKRVRSNLRMNTSENSHNKPKFNQISRLLVDNQLNLMTYSQLEFRDKPANFT